MSAIRHRDPAVIVGLMTGGGVPVMNTWKIEYLAAELYHQAGELSVHALASAAGCTLWNGDELPDSVQALLMPDGLMVRSGCDEPEIKLMTLHELARWVLRPYTHSECDVGQMGLMIAAPLPLLQRMALSGEVHAERLSTATNLPIWAAEKRLAMSTVQSILRVSMKP